MFSITCVEVASAKRKAAAWQEGGVLTGPWWSLLNLPHIATVYRLKFDADKERAR